METSFGFVALLIYFAPSLVAAMRNHHQQGAIFALNLLLGWTVLAWIICLVWSVSAKRQPTIVIKVGHDGTYHDNTREAPRRLPKRALPILELTPDMEVPPARTGNAPRAQ